MKNLIKNIQNTASLNDLWQKDSKIIVGVSGGPDSACLLDILAKIKEKYDIELHIAHVNYRLRGKDSEKDEKFVQKLAEKYQLGLSALKVNKLKKNEITEENLRNIRYDFFEKTRKKLAFDYITVAHNQGDQVETFFLHLLRGAGLQGLSGMKYKSNNIIRPLLGISRKEILEYLKSNRLKYRMDKTNKTDKFFRNKIRNKLIPYLEKNFNPNIKKTILESSLNISDDLDFISSFAEKIFKKTKALKTNEIIKLHPAIQKRIILKAIEEKRGSLRDIEISNVKELLKVLKSTKSKNQAVLFKGLKLTRGGDKLTIEKQ
ncbi:MAG: tRNA lysidine(34) synthetase TilS [Patescibacteria group bacterium]